VDHPPVIYGNVAIIGLNGNGLTSAEADEFTELIRFI
jgi:hypothetical protein